VCRRNRNNQLELDELDEIQIYMGVLLNTAILSILKRLRVV